VVVRGTEARGALLLGLVTFLAAQDATAGRAQLVILLLGNLVGSVAAAPATTTRRSRR
jgi:hypothetical protein